MKITLTKSINHYINKRKIAINWWNYYNDKYRRLKLSKKYYGNNVYPENLTGLEIEYIYTKENENNTK